MGRVTSLRDLHSAKACLSIFSTFSPMVRSVRRRQKSNALNVELFCAVKSPTHFLGIPYTGVKKLTSFDDVKTIIDDLKAKGVDNAVITLSGWNAGGLESTLNTKVSVDKKVGSVKDIKSLVAYAEENGVELVFDNDVQTFYYGT